MQSSVTWNHHFPLAIAAAPSLTWRSTVLGILSTSMATIIAFLLVPEDPTTPGALFYPALVMSAGLATPPLAAAFRHPKAILRGESLLALAPIYWLLLDLPQGVYSLDHITADEAKMPVAIAPQVPPMPWTAQTSSASSTRSRSRSWIAK